MINIIIIGHQGQGKTTFVKKYIQGKRAFVFDVQNEYKEFPTDTNRKVSRLIDLDHDKFVSICTNKRNTVCVCEDATGFVEGRLSAAFRKILVSKRHSGNVNVAVFHSILSVPPRIIQLSDYIVIFKTTDERILIERSRPSLLSYYDKLKKMPDFSYITIKL